MYNKIYNPINKTFTDIKSKEGKNILINYVIKQVGSGSANTGYITLTYNNNTENFTLVKSSSTIENTIKN